jgi:T5SS/PEP-CTERM-associated repeat protein
MAFLLLTRSGASRLLGAAFLLAWISLPRAAPAQTFWIAENPANWYTPSNWSAGVPTSSTHAEINNGGTARLFDPAAVARDLVLGNSAVNSGTLEVMGGEATVSRNLWVGDAGAGTLRISGGGVVTNPNHEIEIGRVSGSTGAVTVDGPRSRLEDAVFVGDMGAVIVGHAGAGSLSVTNGGTVTSFDGDLAFSTNSTGTATIDGTGSNWTIYGPIDVGVRGMGTLVVTNGGIVTNTSADIGSVASATGLVTVSGTGSQWGSSGVLLVGVSGNGTLGIAAGGVVSNTDANIGTEVGSTGTVTVAGSGSTWTNTSVLAVGSSGTGSLTVTGGGVVNSFLGRIARNAGSIGTVLIDGTGSRWNVGNVFTMGLAGTGTAALEVRNGGVVSVSVGMTVGPGGTLRGDGTIAAAVSAAGGLIAPGNSTGSSTGTLHVMGSYAQSTLDATLQIELSSDAAFDKLAATGAMTLGGKLDIQLANGYVPHGMRSFDILDWGLRSGVFDSISLPTLGGTLAWDVSQLYTTGVLSVVGPPAPILAADFDEDGEVDGDDLTRWRMGFGTGIAHMLGNADGDGDVDGNDFLVWQRQLGSTTPSAQVAAPIPEPTSYLLAAAACAGIYVRRCALAPVIDCGPLVGESMF